MKRSLPTEGVPPQFKIYGQVYRFTGPLLAAEGRPPVHGQMYFYENENFDPSVARMQAVNLPDTNLARRIMQQITDVIHNVNEHIRSFKTATEIIQEDINATGATMENYRVVLIDRHPPNEHERRYNLPISNEVAILTPGTGIVFIHFMCNSSTYSSHMYHIL